MELSQYWIDPMFAPRFGMDEIPNAFVKENKHGWNKNVNLSYNLKLGVIVKKVENIVKGQGKNVKITCLNAYRKTEEYYYGDAVFVMVPIKALQNMDIPLNDKQRKALNGAFFIHATKILLQCRRRFWQKAMSYKQRTNLHNDLQGGYTITDEPIGRIFYPNYVGSGIGRNARGILTVYTLQDSAVKFGKDTVKTCISEAIAQISRVHPEIKAEFETGVVQAWDKDQKRLCAFAELNPPDYIESMKAFESTGKYYIGGELFFEISG
ncbi:L-amino-acid oxidase-like [Ruditapes philippinarum]|uniref:L-amino-acid oxidase-like n=1 Tax=Ruditapes philippinarum TaxID=129788 RepID=UPI00295A955F|nr:L-amino-acid oxidase-like [Ruditapes philippinarum]